MSPRFVLRRENVPCVAEVVNRSLKADCIDFMILAFYNIAIFDKYFGGFGSDLKASPPLPGCLVRHARQIARVWSSKQVACIWLGLTKCTGL